MTTNSLTCTMYSYTSPWDEILFLIYSTRIKMIGLFNLKMIYFYIKIWKQTFIGQLSTLVSAENVFEMFKSILTDSHTHNFGVPTS